MFDGDLILLIDEPIMNLGVDKNCPIVINIDEKMTAIAQEINKENLAELVCRTLVSLIGECSNAATCYHNKHVSTKEQKEKYEKYVDILSIVNSFAIDFAKTGYIMNIPYHIAKYSKPYPYFMRYISDYYESLYQSMEKNNSSYRFSKSNSNMNKLSFFIEKFHNKEIKWKRNKLVDNKQDFDYNIMINENVEIDEDKFEKIHKVFHEFNEQIKYLSLFEKKLHNYDKYKEELKAWDKESATSYEINWDSVYSKYKNICEEICPDKIMLANICVKLCYEKHVSYSKRFMWVVSSYGILENIKQENILIPVKDDCGNFEYLGKRYSMMNYPNV